MYIYIITVTHCITLACIVWTNWHDVAKIDRWQICLYKSILAKTIQLTNSLTDYNQSVNLLPIEQLNMQQYRIQCASLLSNLGLERILLCEEVLLTPIIAPKVVRQTLKRIVELHWVGVMHFSSEFSILSNCDQE